jgi:hypothetical protein
MVTITTNAETAATAYLTSPSRKEYRPLTHKPE